MTDAVIAMTTTNNSREAKSLAEGLVKERMAACVQIISKIESIYEWDGKICDEQEYLLIIKTREGCIDAIKKYMTKHHSYEVPEFLVTPVIEGMEEYLKWMKGNIKI